MAETPKRTDRPNALHMNPAFIDFRRRAREEGGSSYDIAHQMGVPVTTARNWAKVVLAEEDYVQKGATSLVQTQKGPNRTKAQRQEIKSEMIVLWSQGKGPKIIAAELSIPEISIKRWAREMGLSRTFKHSNRDPAAITAPIPWAELSEEARELLGDFGRFRAEVLGTAATPRRILPWATEAAEQLLSDYYSPEDEYDVVNVGPGLGKALALDTPLRTPTGWTTMKDVQVGDELYGTDGRPCRVTFKSEVFYAHKCYEVTTDDGASVIADADHLWSARLKPSYPKPWYPGKTGPKPSAFHTYTTAELARERAKRPMIPLAAPLLTRVRRLPIDPYVLGCWLGDGDSAGAGFTSDDPEIVEAIRARGYEVVKYPQPFRYGIRRLSRQLRRAGLMGNKHVPETYHRAAPAQRLALLQGLIDTDGYVSAQTGTEFTSTNRRLAEAVQALVRSLGVKANLHEGRATLDGRDCGPKYRVTFWMKDCARLPRKAAQARDGVRTPGRYLTITRVPSVPTQCVMVDSPDHLYLAGEGLLVTHNTTLITHDFVVWFVTLERAKGREPTIQLGHRSGIKSSWYVKRLRQTFTYNSKLIKLYGRFKPTDNMSAWSTTEIAVEPLHPEDRGEKEPTVSSASYEGSILSGRFRLIIWDDLIDKSNSTTVEARDQMKEWWAVEAETRLEPGGLLVLSNARFGPEDLSQFVTEQVDTDDLDEDEQPRPFYNRIRYKVHYEEQCDGITHTGPWPDGCLLDPVRAGWKRIRRQELASEGRFRLVWQQEDTDPEGNLAEKVWFTGGIDTKGAMRPGCYDLERSFGHVPPQFLETRPALSALSIDPSNSRFWSVQHWLVYPGEIQVLLRAVRRPMQSPDLLYPVEGKAGHYTGVLEDFWQGAQLSGVAPDYLIYEQNAQRGIVQMPFYSDWCQARAVSMVMHETNRVNKHDPDNGVQMNGPMYAFGKVRLPYAGHEEKLYAEQFRREACAYPEGATSDILMTHWFLSHRMRNLMVTTIAENAESDVTDLPSWVRARATFDPRPAWAGGRNLDSRATLGR